MFNMIKAIIITSMLLFLMFVVGSAWLVGTYGEYIGPIFFVYITFFAVAAYLDGRRRKKDRAADIVSDPHSLISRWLAEDSLK
jgi:hypothetical protein